MDELYWRVDESYLNVRSFPMASAKATELIFMIFIGDVVKKVLAWEHRI